MLITISFPKHVSLSRIFKFGGSYLFILFRSRHLFQNMDTEVSDDFDSHCKKFEAQHDCGANKHHNTKEETTNCTITLLTTLK